MARPVVWLVEGCKVLKKNSKVSINNFISSDCNTGITIQFFFLSKFLKTRQLQYAIINYSVHKIVVKLGGMLKSKVEYLVHWEFLKNLFNNMNAFY